MNDGPLEGGMVMALTSLSVRFTPRLAGPCLIQASGTDRLHRALARTASTARC